MIGKCPEMTKPAENQLSLNRMKKMKNYRKYRIPVLNKLY